MQSKNKIFIIIFFVALVARLFYLEQIKDTFLFNCPIVDSGTFEHIGWQIASGALGNGEDAAFNKIPLYYNFIATCYRLIGRNLYFVRLVQSVIGAFNCGLLFLLGALIFRRRVGIIAGIVASLYWPLIAFEAKFLPVNLAIFFSILTVVFLYLFLETKNKTFIFTSGLSFAFASIARANMLLLFPVYAAWIFFYFLKEKKRAIICTAVFIFAFSLIIAPPILKDYGKTQEFMPVQNNYAIGVYFGLSLEHINVKPGSAWKNLMMDLLDDDLTHARERIPYWFKKGKDLIAGNPAKYTKEFFKKLYVFGNHYELSPRESINYFRQKSSFLSLPLFNFGIVFPFAIMGMFVGWREFRKKAMPIYLFVFTYAASVIPFMPLSRYRLPIVPFLIIFAAYGFFKIAETIKIKKWNHFAKYIVFIVPILVVSNSNYMQTTLESFSRPYYHEGLMYVRAKDYSTALISLQTALKKHPNDADIFETTGDAYAGMGELEKAEVNYKMALTIQPRFPKAMNKLGVVYARMGKMDKAKELFIQAITSFPTDLPELHINLGNCYKFEKDHKNAEKEYKRALHFSPNNLQALFRLATLYEEVGDKEGAERVWRKYNKILMPIH